MKLASECLFGLILSLSPLASANENQLVVRLDGFSTLRTFDRNGQLTEQESPKRFSIWLSGCKWAVNLIADTNRPGGITQITCDTTNVYVFVPDAGGKTVVGDKLEPFSQAGDVYPGTIKPFPFRMGPIWWAYCSSCETDLQSGAIPDLMNLTGHGLATTLRINKASASMNGIVGPVEQWVSLTNDSSNQATPLARIKPNYVFQTNGISLVTSCSVIVYYTLRVIEPNATTSCRI